MERDRAGSDATVELAAQKRRIRREALSRRDALTEEQCRRAACLITERLLGHQWFYLAQNILCYVSYGSELSTRELIVEALRLGKQVYVPRVIGTGQMVFCRISALEELQPGFHGIGEPSATAAAYDGAQGGERVLMVMPGVAFDAYGNRLGYGGGYYDRYLAAHPQFQTCSIAVGYTCQLVEWVPQEETDCRPYQVILV